MIFNVHGHVDMIRNGLFVTAKESQSWRYEGGIPYSAIVKTQTRRRNRGIYQVGRDYAVQRKRGVKAESDIRIMMDRIWREDCFKPSPFSPNKHHFAPISKEEAWAEGGYTVEEYERLFRELNPKWDGWSRWVFEYHMIEVKDKCRNT